MEYKGSEHQKIVKYAHLKIETFFDDANRLAEQGWLVQQVITDEKIYISNKSY